MRSLIRHSAVPPVLLRRDVGSEALRNGFGDFYKALHLIKRPPIYRRGPKIVPLHASRATGYDITYEICNTLPRDALDFARSASHRAHCHLRIVSEHSLLPYLGDLRGTNIYPDYSALLRAYLTLPVCMHPWISREQTIALFPPQHNSESLLSFFQAHDLRFLQPNSTSSHLTHHTPVQLAATLMTPLSNIDTTHAYLS